MQSNKTDLNLSESSINSEDYWFLKISGINDNSTEQKAVASEPQNTETISE